MVINISLTFFFDDCRVNKSLPVAILLKKIVSLQPIYTTDII